MEHYPSYEGGLREDFKGLQGMASRDGFKGRLQGEASREGLRAGFKGEFQGGP